jgi:lipopolysaccharide/colanic/teichoic acid biosynthesis glycosyltransferase
MKRFFDCFICVNAFLVLLPLFAFLFLLVAIFLGRPVFFKQKRPGYKGSVFEILKFRSMLDSKGGDGLQLPDMDRLTVFGKLLRSTSLDELPSLLNVIKGDMSLVGPRPLLVGYLPLYSKQQARRHDVRPGVTGWAQVNGRNAISWGEKFELDVWYVDNQSLLLDFKIILLTIKKVLLREGVNSENHVTVEPFKGEE